MDGVGRAISQTGSTTGTSRAIKLRQGDTAKTRWKTNGTDLAALATGSANHALLCQAILANHGKLLPRRLLRLD